MTSRPVPVAMLMMMYPQAMGKDTKVQRITWGQFHQHSTSSFYAPRSQKRKKLLDVTVFFALLVSAHVKAACIIIMWMKFNPGVNFTNVLMQSFYASRIQNCKKESQVVSRKKVDQLVELLYFGGFALYAVHSSLIKLTPGEEVQLSTRQKQEPNTYFFKQNRF